MTHIANIRTQKGWLCLFCAIDQFGERISHTSACTRRGGAIGQKALADAILQFWRFDPLLSERGHNAKFEKKQRISWRRADHQHADNALTLMN